MKESSIPQPRKILVVKLCCLGDAIFMTPSLRAIRQKFPQAEIAYLGSTWIKPILEQIRFIDKILLFDAPRSSASRREKVLQTLRLIRELRRERFDTVVVCHRSPVLAALGILSGIRTRVGFDSRFNRLLLNRPVDFVSEKNEVLRFADLVQALGVSVEDTATELALPADEVANAKEILRAIGIGPADKVVGIFPGGGENPGTKMTIKRWEAEKWSILCRRILDEYQVQLVFLGSPADSDLNDQVINDVSTSRERMTNIAGKSTLRGLPAVLAACDVVAGGDTGPMHMSAAAGTKTLLLYGPTDPRLLAPLQDNAKYLWKHIACSPCFTPDKVSQKGSFDRMVFGCWTGTHDCMKTLTVDEVFEALRPWLNDLKVPRVPATEISNSDSRISAPTTP